MANAGMVTNVVGLLISVGGTVLLFVHTTNEYHASLQDMDSIAIAYLGLIVLGLTVSVTGVALLVSASND